MYSSSPMSSARCQWLVEGVSRSLRCLNPFTRLSVGETALDFLDERDLWFGKDRRYDTARLIISRVVDRRDTVP